LLTDTSLQMQRRGAQQLSRHLTYHFL